MTPTAPRWRASSSTGSTAGRPATASCRWTPRCTSSPRSAAGPARPNEQRAADSPYNTYKVQGSAAGPDRQPGPGLDRGRRQPGRRRLALLRHGRPGHRGDEVRRDRGGARAQRARVPGVVLGEPGQVLRAAVLGSPIAHSLSPVLHRAGYAAAGLTTWRYDAHEVDAAGLPALRRRARPAVAGAVADDAAQGGGRRGSPPRSSPVARLAGAVEHPGPPRGRGLGRHQHRRRRRRARAAAAPARRGDARRSSSGAGATARSAVLALAELGVTTLTVRARDGGRAADLLAWALDLGIGVRNGSAATLGPWGTDRDDVVVSTVPAAAGRRRRRDGAAGPPRGAPRRRLRRVADAAGAGRPGCRDDRRAGPRHARAPGGGAVPAVHRRRARRSRRWRRRGGPPWGTDDPVVGGRSPWPSSWAWSATSPGRELATGGYRIPEDEADHPPGRNWWPGLATAALAALAAWAVGDLAGWAALPAYLLFAWLTVGLVWIDLDVHRLPVGLVVPTGAVARSRCWPWRRWRRGTGAGSGAVVGFVVMGGIYLLLAVLPGGGVGGGDVRLAPLIGALLGWLGIGAAGRRPRGRLPRRGSRCCSAAAWADEPA